MGAVCDTFYSPIPTYSKQDPENVEMADVEISPEDYRKYIENYVITNKLNEVPSSLDRIEMLNHVDPDFKKPLLLLACESKGDFNEVDSNSIKLLVEKGANIDYIDNQWYGWEALHYTAAAANAEKLETICELLPKSKINSLTTLSENALHVLLDHGTYAESLNVSCQNGVVLKMSKIIGCEKKSIIDCVNILLKAEIDVNHSNFWNETPILIAIKRKYFEVVKILLKIEKIDLDGCRDAISGKTARELLKGKESYFGLMLQHGVASDPNKVLFQFMKSGDEESFLKYNGGKISKYVKIVDGDSFHNSSCTLLQYCFRRGLIAWYQDKRRYDYESQFHYSDITANHLVQVFCQNGMAKSIQHLLDNGADIDFTMRKFNVSLLEVAAMKGYYPLVCLVLGREDTNFSSGKICDIIRKLLENSGSDIDLDNTLSILLHRLLISKTPIPSQDLDTLMKMLTLGVRIVSKENLRLFLKFPTSLCTQNMTKSILEEIDPEVTQNHLDECVEHKNDKIIINYESFIKNGSTREVLRNFLKSPVLNNFLNHLVFKILINRMWERLRIKYDIKYFYINFFFYITFYVLLNVFVLQSFNNVDSYLTSPIFCFGVLCLGIFTFKEVVQAVAKPSMYIKDFNNLAELFFISSTLAVYIDQNVYSMVLSILSSNLVLLLLLEQVPIFAKYIIILRTLVYYLKYILFYFIQFLAFAICFYILFSKEDQKFWNDLPTKVFETIILFTGNLDYMDTNKWEKNELFAKVVFTIFVLFMAIILHNLLLGLLVTDMGNLNNSVKLFEQMKRASFVVRVEKFFTTWAIKRFFPYLVVHDDDQKRKIFDEQNKYLIVNDNDRYILDENEKQYLDFILVKKVKKQNVLKKLYSYIKSKINERYCEGGQEGEINREILEKLHLIEERIKNLHDTNEMLKAELNKNCNN